MKEALIAMVSGLPHEVAVFLLAAMPIVEVRGSIPVALAVYDLSPVAAIAYSLAGNIAAGALVLMIALPLMRFLIARVAAVRTLWERYIHRIETKNRAAFDRWGAVALVLFVAIPLPMTGVFTGAVAASIFGVPLRRALPLLLLGSLIACILVVLITRGAQWIL